MTYSVLLRSLAQRAGGHAFANLLLEQEVKDEERQRRQGHDGELLSDDAFRRHGHRAIAGDSQRQAYVTCG